ncbi:MAG: hypothetical protein RLZZ387_2983 [Chloroflexota bacterium]|jgi:hypothetical protein
MTDRHHIDQSNREPNRHTQPSHESSSPAPHGAIQRMTAPGGQVGASDLLAAQRAAGNHAVQRSLSGQASGPAVQRAPGGGVIQRALAPMTVDVYFSTYLYDYTTQPSTDPNTPARVTVDDDVVIGHKLKDKYVIQVDTTRKDVSGKYAYAENGPYKGYIPLNDIKAGGTVAPAKKNAKLTKSAVQETKSVTENPEGEEVSQLELAGEVTDTAGGSTDDMATQLDIDSKELKDGYYKDKEEPEGAKKDEGPNHTENLNVAAGVGDTLTGIFSFVKAVKDMADGGAETLDRIGAGFEGADALAKTTAGVTKVVDSSAKVSGSDKGIGASDSAGKWTGSIGDVFAGIKEGFMTVKRIWETYKEAQAGELSNREKFKAGMDIVLGLLNTATSALKAARGFLEIINDGISQALTAAIPGLSIAISGATIIVRVIDIISAAVNKGRMKEMRQQFKKKYASSGVVNEQRTKLHWYSSTVKKSQKVDPALLAERKKYLEAYIGYQATELPPELAAIGGAPVGTKAEAEKELKNIQGSAFGQLAKKAAGKDQKKLDALIEQRRAYLTAIVGNPPIELPATLSGAGAKGAVSKDEAKAELADINTYHVATEMKKINQERVVEGSVDIGVEVVKIAGDIATLSGVGAVAGMPLKFIASGVNLGRSAYKKGMQLYYDKTNDAENSTQAKNARRVGHARTILEMARDLPNLSTPPKQGEVAPYKVVERLIAATGVDLAALYRKKTAKEQIELLVKGMATI